MRSVGADRWACGSGADRPLRDAGEREQAGVSWAEGEEVGRSRVGSGREGKSGLLGFLGRVWLACWVWIPFLISFPF